MPIRKRTNKTNRGSQVMPYARECCDGSLWSQGIGRITG